jgi:hypothetical protein
MSCVIRVSDGQGFVARTPEGLVVVTAAHCLPSLPPAHLVSSKSERTYANILGPLGAEPSVWAECLFADPVADIVLLGEPDGQSLPDECERYLAFLQQYEVVKIVDGEPDQSVRMRSPSGGWFKARGRHSSKAIYIDNEEQNVEDGMSGSPILSDSGAVALVSTGGFREPALAACLPSWALRWPTEPGFALHQRSDPRCSQMV